MKLRLLSSITAIALLAGCATPGVSEKDAAAAIEAEANAARLAVVLEAQSEDAKARYKYRNPAETLAFFGIEPGMKVAEALPGGGWYSKILLPYLGSEGMLVGAQYPNDMWPRFGIGPEFEERMAARSANWTTQAAEWAGDDAAALGNYSMTQMPAEMEGTLDAVLFIRALHNLSRFDAETGYLDTTAQETFRALKPGGIVGVVQHRAPEDKSAEWASGSAGYIKQSDVIATFEAAGFVLEATSEINANPADKPGADDVVWRLPPSLRGTEEGTPERAAVEAIGESDRMTLRFRKPA